MSHKSRFVLLLVAAVIIFALLSWLPFHPSVSAIFSGNSVILTFLLIAGIAPIYPLYLQVRKRSALHAVFTALLIGVLISAVVYVIASRLFHVDSPWVSLVFKLNTGLILAACALAIWKAARKEEADN